MTAGQVVVQAPEPPPMPVLLPGEAAPLIAIVVIALALVIVLWPIVRAYARRVEGRGGDTGELRAELDDLRQRLAEVESQQVRLTDLEERLDFAERVLARGRASERLPEEGA